MKTKTTWAMLDAKSARVEHAGATPASAHVPSEGPLPRFETGRISEESTELILNTLAVDFTFIDETDTVRLFSNSAGRIFTRPKATIGRKIQSHHR